MNSAVLQIYRQTPFKECNLAIVSRLEREGLTSGTIDRIADLSGSNKVIVIRHASQVTLLGRVLAIAKVIVLRNRVSIIGRVQRLLGVDPLVRLDEQLRALAGVDAVADLLEVVVVQVAGAEAEGRAARVQVVPVVVGEGDAEVALVFVAVAVRVADQRGFPVVVDVGVGDGHVVGGVGELVC